MLSSFDGPLGPSKSVSMLSGYHDTKKGIKYQGILDPDTAVIWTT